jgi:ribosomal protein S18 acetylase RimI-like enzyme
VIDPVLIEQLADAAWPAAEQAPLGPWKLRATHGVTRRANSVFTAGTEEAGSAAELTKWVQAAEAFYLRRSLPAVFQISAATGASGLDALLANRGYAVNGVSEVWTLETRTFKAKQPDGEWAVRRSDDPDEAWFDCAFDEIAQRRRVHEQIVRRAPQPRLFVSASAADATVVGCGMATSAQGHAGIFCMATRPTHRRRGVGLALVRELCAWTVERADQRIFLQVMTENEAAKTLYRKVGFESAYSYHYRVR